jgi:putative phosphoesterase
MKIGLISDTHGHLPGKVHDAFKTVDLILHAGDIGSQDIINELETIAPVYAVHGNIDGWPLRKIYPSHGS